jgi:hypothetical protein
MTVDYKIWNLKRKTDNECALNGNRVTAKEQVTIGLWTLNLGQKT